MINYGANEKAFRWSGLMEANEKIYKKILEDESFVKIFRIHMLKKFINALAHNRL